MSAKGRSPRSSKDASQFFATPHWSVRRLLEAVDLPGGLWLEPCAGQGDIIRAVSRVRRDVVWHAIEYREACWPLLSSLATVNVALPSNFFEVIPDDRYVAVVMNPPFSSSLRFVQHALEFSPIVIALLRLGWIAPEKQSAWLREHMPDVYVLPNRPDFTGDGGDATEYAWMRFFREERRVGQFTILNRTTPSERAREKRPKNHRTQLQLPLEVQP